MLIKTRLSLIAIVLLFSGFGNSYAHNKVVVVPLGSNFNSPLCGSDINDPCIVGTGACQRAGIMMCNDQLNGTQCSAAPGTPSAEACNYFDDDCDGSVDEGYDGLNTICQVGVGACQAQGFFICDGSDPFGNPVCDAVPGNPSPVEVCNYIDDNCDGQVDEDFINLAGQYDHT